MGFDPCKQRVRGASDQEHLWSLIECLASGRGKLRDLDEVRADEAARGRLVLAKISSSRRIGEWLSRPNPTFLPRYKGLRRVLANLLTPMLAGHLVAARDCGLRPLIRDVIGTVGKLTRTAQRCTLWRAISNFQLGWLLQACRVQDEWWQLSPG